MRRSFASASRHEDDVIVDDRRDHVHFAARTAPDAHRTRPCPRPVRTPPSPAMVRHLLLRAARARTRRPSPAAGSGATTRPSSSATTASSGKPRPMPPCSSGIVSACQSRATNVSHSVAAGVGRLRRTRRRRREHARTRWGTRCVSTDRTESRSSSCSAVKSSCISPRRLVRVDAQRPPVELLHRRERQRIGDDHRLRELVCRRGGRPANERSSSRARRAATRSRSHDDRDTDLAHHASGRGATATAAIAGWVASTASTSMGYTL